jgi:hypothetical protein
MKYFCVARALSLCAACFTSLVHAGPMGYSGSTMAMGDFGPNWSELWTNYAITSRDAVGAEVLAMRSDDKSLTRELTGLTYTRLGYRWNQEHAQANVWLMAGVGAVRGNTFEGTRTIFTPGVQLDYETTRIYLAAYGRLYRAPGLNHDYGSVRAGFSFIEADYDEVQPWFILEARRMRNLSDRIELTPMLRFISKNYFVEIGANNSKQVRFNFMYVF